MSLSEHLEDLALKDSYFNYTNQNDNGSSHLNSHPEDLARNSLDVEEEEADIDIYRGEPIEPFPQTKIRYSEDPDRYSVASSASSSSLNVGRRLGGLANVVEAAISRWAKLHSSASSITTSTSSSTESKSLSKRRPRPRRRMSTATFQSHEQAILLRKRAHEQSKTIPREFNLLLPSQLIDSVQGTSRKTVVGGNRIDNYKRTVKTSSLSEVMRHLDQALKRSTKHKKHNQDRSVGSEPASSIDKGKHKATSKGEVDQVYSTLRRQHSPVNLSEKGWWLDVANPTFDDLRKLAKLLHLHPLTMEDILHQDPREKLELFPGLGYYFIVFRALESERARERFRQYRTHSQDGSTNTNSVESAVGAVNVYLVVFKEGICTFHFEDISEHTEKLRTRILSLEDTFNLTSDWIAHGLLDSIVDSFFPILTIIEKEVKEVNTLVLNRAPSMHDDVNDHSRADATAEKSISISEKSVEVFSEVLNEKSEGDGLSRRSCAELSFLSWPDLRGIPNIRRLRQHIIQFSWAQAIKKLSRGEEKEEVVSTSSKTLLRMTATRRIVTSLGRLLSSKGDVIAQIRKRMHMSSPEATSTGLAIGGLDGDIEIYMGDIQDHIVTFQQSLAYYERMLSQSQPAYISQLRVSQSVSKGGTDTAILSLTTVSMVVLCIQLILGLFSINILQIPRNNIDGKKYNVFAVILSGAVLIGFGVIALVRYWQHRAKRKYSRRSRL